MQKFDEFCSSRSRAGRGKQPRVHVIRNRDPGFAPGVFLCPLIVRKITAITLIDLTPAAGNIFLMDNASHFVIIFARGPQRARSVRSHRNEIRTRACPVDLYFAARRGIYYLRVPRVLPRDYFLIVRLGIARAACRGETEGSAARPLFPVRHGDKKLKSRPQYFEVLSQIFCFVPSAHGEMSNEADAFFQPRCAQRQKRATPKIPAGRGRAFAKV